MFSNPLFSSGCVNLFLPQRYVSTSQELLVTSRDQDDTDVLDACAGFSDGDVGNNALRPLKLVHSDRERCTRQSACGNTYALGTLDDCSDGESDDGPWLDALFDRLVFPLSRARKLYPTKRFYTKRQWCTIPVDLSLPMVGERSVQRCGRGKEIVLQGAGVRSHGRGAGQHRSFLLWPRTRANIHKLR